MFFIDIPFKDSQCRPNRSAFITVCNKQLKMHAVSLTPHAQWKTIRAALAAFK
jgi:hypothetical protein